MYGIKSHGEWLTQNGRIITCNSAEILAETFVFGEVTRLRGWDRLRRSVDLRDAFRKSEQVTVHHRATRWGVDQLIGFTEPYGSSVPVVERSSDREKS